MKFHFNFHTTALSCAVERGDPEIVSILLDHQEIDVNAKMVKY